MTNATPAAALIVVAAPPGEVGGPKPPTPTALVGRSSHQPPYPPPNILGAVLVMAPTPDNEASEASAVVEPPATTAVASLALHHPPTTTTTTLGRGPSTCGLANVHLRLLARLMPRPHHRTPSSSGLLASGQFLLRHMGRPCLRGPFFACTRLGSTHPRRQLPNVTLQQPPQQEWHFDTGASSHMTSDADIISHPSSSQHLPTHIIIGNGHLIPVTSTGTTHLPYNLSLHNVLVSPSLIKDLISVR